MSTLPFAAFVLLVVVYVPLGIGNLVGSAGAANALMKAGGWFGLVDSLAALYLCAAIVLNDVSGRTLLPIWSASRGTRLISGRTVCSILPAVRTRFGEGPAWKGNGPSAKCFDAEGLAGPFGHDSGQPTYLVRACPAYSRPDQAAVSAVTRRHTANSWQESSL